MKYIELYLNKRKEELENLKKEEIEKFKEKYRNCVNDQEIESLMEDTYIDHYIMIDSYNMRLKEIENLKEDLIPIEDSESKGE